MKIFIDIGHPAHVHYFRNFIGVMKQKGHSVFISARDKEVAQTLLNFYSLPYISRGKGKKGLLGKFLYILQADSILLKEARKIKPDVFLSFGSPYAAHIAWLMRKPHIAFDDTDHSFFEHLISIPFTKTLVTPQVYLKDYGKKHVRFDGFMELCSLHPNWFRPQPDSIKPVSETNQNRYVVLRFVSWDASHDVTLSGLSLDEKYALVEEISKYARVVISSEQPLPADLQQYAYKPHPAYMHDLLNGAELIVSESLTMAAEAAFLGTPALCISTAKAGTLYEEVKLGLIELFRTGEGLINRAVEIIKDNNYKPGFKKKSAEIVSTKTDVTSFMIWLVENYPKSLSVIEKDPNYQYSLSNK